MSEEELKQTLIEMNDKGMSYMEMSMELNKDPTSIYGYFRKFGIEKKKVPSHKERKQLSDKDIAKILDLYTNDHVPIKAIAYRYHINYSHVKDILVDNNVKTTKKAISLWR